MSAVATTLRENRKPKLAELLVQTLRRQIAAGEFAARRKLPTESQLAAAFGVSRTVVREAIAALAADGLVHARQGAGIFVTAGPAAAFTAIGADRSDRISAAIAVLEVRMGLEIEAAGLAALRRSASQEAAILEAFNDFDRLLAGAAPTGKADFALHRAIAAATNNPFYVEVLDGLGSRTIPCDVVSPWGTETVLSHEYQAGLQREHDAIVTAIAAQDAETARAAMRTHLLNSQQRYRARLRDPSPLRSLP